MSPRGLTMRRLTSEDADTLLSALITLAPVLELQGQASPTALAALLARPDAYVVAAFAGEEAAGLATAFAMPSLEHDAGLAYLYDVAVAEPHRGQGIGTALIKGVLDCCKADGITLVWAGTETGNSPARKIFEKAGGTRAGGPYMEYAFDL